MPEALIAAFSSVAVALIAAGVIGQNRKKKEIKAATDPILLSILDKWRDCEQRWSELNNPPDGKDGPS